MSPLCQGYQAWFLTVPSDNPQDAPIVWSGSDSEGFPIEAYPFIDPPGDLFPDGIQLFTTDQTLGDQVYFRITDAFFPGDAFSVFVNGQLALITPSVQSNPAIRITDPSLTFGDPNFSWDQLTLGPGVYNITIFAREGATSGGAFVQATPTSEPTTMLLLGTGLFSGVAEIRRRRRMKKDLTLSVLLSVQLCG
ncbi:MAG: PEP-CTERM sorting domain-containing protein [Pyrinomonadaceae bacterium]